MFHYRLIKIRIAFVRNACGPSFKKQLMRVIQSRTTWDQLERFSSPDNDSGCKALRVDGRKCVPYNNLSLQPETRRPLSVSGEVKDSW
jgi:hypothetical protein